MRDEYDEKIRKMKEDIESRKEVLNNMSEKELLISVMIALDGYGSRIERLENASGYEEVANQVNALIPNITDKLEHMADDIIKKMESYNILKQIGDIQSKIDDIQYTVCNEAYKNDSIPDAIDSLQSDISFMKTNIDDIRSSVCDRHTYDSLASSIDSISSELWSIRSACEDAKSAAESAQNAIEIHSC